MIWHRRLFSEILLGTHIHKVRPGGGINRNLGEAIRILHFQLTREQISLSINWTNSIDKSERRLINGKQWRCLRATSDRIPNRSHPYHPFIPPSSSPAGPIPVELVGCLGAVCRQRTGKPSRRWHSRQLPAGSHLSQKALSPLFLTPRNSQFPVYSVAHWSRGKRYESLARDATINASDQRCIRARNDFSDAE